MEYSIIKLKLKSRYCVILITILDIIINIIGWITYEMKLFYYKECSFRMNGNSVCNGTTFSNKCFAETDQECDNAFTIVHTYYYALILLAIYQGYCWLVFFLQCCFPKCQGNGCTKLNLILKIMFYSISGALFSFTTSYVIELGKTNVSLNGQIFTACIAIGILCFLNIFCQSFVIYELFYLKEIAKIEKLQANNNFEKQRTSTEPVDHNQIQIQQYPQNNYYGQVPQPRYSNSQNNYRMRQN